MNLPAPAQLEVSDLHKRYGTHEVLKGVGLSARPGDVISLIGSSGSGKSTLLRCINLLERPSQGRIRLGGQELALVPGPDGQLRAASKPSSNGCAPGCPWCSSISTCGRT